LTVHSVHYHRQHLVASDGLLGKPVVHSAEWLS